MCSQNNSSPNRNKRKAGNDLPPPQQKLLHSAGDAVIRSSSCQTRWLVESCYCAKVLGPGGKRLRSMRESTREAGVTSRISANLPDCEYRIFCCTGSPSSVSIIGGLFVKAIFDEPAHEECSCNSKRYDLKLLIPRRNLEALVGINDKYLADIEEKSHALVSYEPKNIGSSDEVCVHLYGVADAIQNALLLVSEKLKKVEEFLGDASTSSFKWFEPMAGSSLIFTEGRKSDVAIRSRGNPDRNSADSSTVSVRSGNGTASPSATNSHDLPQKTLPTLTLPPLSNNANVPQNIITAYNIARDSQKKHLRQFVQIDSARKGTQAEREALIENIRRVTKCRIELGIGESIDDFANYEQMDSDKVSLVIDGIPEENMLALFLIYRFLKQ